MRTLTVVLAGMAAAFVVTHARASAQEAVAAPAMSAADTNELIGRRCVVCHNTAKPLGGLNFQPFDAEKPDPAVALMMSVKVSNDGAMAAAGNPTPGKASIDEFLRVMNRWAIQDKSGPWIVDLQVDPRTPARGHSLVVAQRRSDAGDVRLTCNGATRQLDVSPMHSPIDLEGLSPIVHDVFAWCLGDAPAPKGK